MNIENLKIAVEGIKALNLKEDQFDISIYGGIVSEMPKAAKRIIRKCNTVACFIGWFPFVEDLKPVDSDYASFGFNYVEYSKRILDLDIDKYEDTLLWEYLFHQRWKIIEPTLEQALQRAQNLIDNPDFDFMNEPNFIKLLNL